MTSIESDRCSICNQASTSMACIACSRMELSVGVCSDSCFLAHFSRAHRGRRAAVPRALASPAPAHHYYPPLHSPVTPSRRVSVTDLLTRSVLTLRMTAEAPCHRPILHHQQQHHHMIFPSPHQHNYSMVQYGPPTQYGPPAPSPPRQQRPAPAAQQVRGSPAMQQAQAPARHAYGTPRPSEYRTVSPMTKAATPAAAGGPPNRTQVNVEVSHM